MVGLRKRLLHIWTAIFNAIAVENPQADFKISSRFALFVGQIFRVDTSLNKRVTPVYQLHAFPDIYPLIDSTDSNNLSFW